jgi:hypothetical protein
MSAFGIAALVWIPVAVALAIGFAFSLDWLEGRMESRKAGHAAE